MIMKIEILSEKENKPLARKEITFRVDHAGAKTPSRIDIRDKIVAEGSACIYSSPEQMKLIELGHIVKRNEPKKKEGAE